jgi:hypothetical protein
MTAALAADLIATLPVDRPGLFNPWRQACAHDAPDNGPEARTGRLAAHLDCPRPRALTGTLLHPALNHGVAEAREFWSRV